jgi:hypothetical protein
MSLSFIAALSAIGGRKIQSVAATAAAKVNQEEFGFRLNLIAIRRSRQLGHHDRRRASA